MNPGRRRQPGLGLMLLFYELFGVIGIDQIPQITLATIGAQIAIYLRFFNFWHDPHNVCVSAYNVLQKKQYTRLIYSAFEHGDDWHLYYNMISFAVKGRTLERRFGSPKFLYILSVFTILTNIVYVALGKFLSDFDSNYFRHCAVGFSGVIFALKVLTTYYDNNYINSVMGIPITIPTKYAVWVELVLIQIINPTASFIGHLAGILVGMAYVLGPLKFVMNTIYGIATSFASPSLSRPRFTPRAEASGYAQSSYSAYVPSGMTEEEQMRRAMDESLRNSQWDTNDGPPYPMPGAHGSSPPPPGFAFGDSFRAPPPAGFAPDIEELRSRRQSRFS